MRAAGKFTFSAGLAKPGTLGSHHLSREGIRSSSIFSGFSYARSISHLVMSTQMKTTHKLVIYHYIAQKCFIRKYRGKEKASPLK